MLLSQLFIEEGLRVQSTNDCFCRLESASRMIGGLVVPAFRAVPVLWNRFRRHAGHMLRNEWPLIINVMLDQTSMVLQVMTKVF
jgi:hypothetical protein